MIRLKPWYRSPSLPLVDGLKQLHWAKTGDLSPAAGIAALMLYVAMIFTAEEELSETGEERWVSSASYETLIKATGGISRSLTSQGIKRLQEIRLIEVEGSPQKRRYLICGLNKARDWYKLPCKDIVHVNVITPFRHMTLRSKYELHALKLYLYLASTRDNKTPFTTASYETIYSRIGIPERDIRRAISLLINSGLLMNVVRSKDDEKPYGPNQYYLAGYKHFFQDKTEGKTALAQP